VVDQLVALGGVVAVQAPDAAAAVLEVALASGSIASMVGIGTGLLSFGKPLG
jgi:hypothetical protein